MSHTTRPYTGPGVQGGDVVFGLGAVGVEVPVGVGDVVGGAVWDAVAVIVWGRFGRNSFTS
jgi:hypothetical protein